jgi:hypothetical protein
MSKGGLKARQLITIVGGTIIILLFWLSAQFAPQQRSAVDGGRIAAEGHAAEKFALREEPDGGNEIKTERPRHVMSSGAGEIVGATEHACKEFELSKAQRIESEAKHREEANALAFSPQNFLNRKIKVWSKAVKGKPMIFCATYTHAKKHANAANVRKYWAHRCDRHVIFTDVQTPIPGVPPEDIIKITPDGGESYHNMWHKMRAILKWIVDNQIPKQYEYFFFGGDDTFVIVENVRKALLEPEIATLNKGGVPLWFGYRMHVMGDKPFAGGGGYIMNSIMVRMFVKLYNHRDCHPNDHGFAEDVYVGDCLRAFGMWPHDAADVFGEDRFMSMTPNTWTAVVQNPKISWWYPMYRVRPMPTGNDAVSVYACLFHFMQASDMEQVNQAVYHGRLENPYKE